MPLSSNFRNPLTQWQYPNSYTNLSFFRARPTTQKCSWEGMNTVKMMHVFTLQSFVSLQTIRNTLTFQEVTTQVSAALLLHLMSFYNLFFVFPLSSRGIKWLLLLFFICEFVDCFQFWVPWEQRPLEFSI